MNFTNGVFKFNNPLMVLREFVNYHEYNKNIYVQITKIYSKIDKIIS